jgi:hypothetical protein
MDPDSVPDPNAYAHPVSVLLSLAEELVRRDMRSNHG